MMIGTPKGNRSGIGWGDVPACPDDIKALLETLETITGIKPISEFQFQEE